MRKIFSMILIVTFIGLSARLVHAGDVYFSGWMVGSGKQHVIYENRSTGYTLKQLKPLIWAGATYIGVMAVEKAVLIPKSWEMKSQEVEMMKIQVNKAKEFSEIEIEKAKKELEFLYSPSKNWKNTPRGKKFLADLSTQVHSRPTYYYFDTGN